jgi:hypothetical protein
MTGNKAKGCSRTCSMSRQSPREFFVGSHRLRSRGRRISLDAQDVHSAQDAAGRLNPGEWLQVEHSIDE